MARVRIGAVTGAVVVIGMVGWAAACSSGPPPVNHPAVPTFATSTRATSSTGAKVPTSCSTVAEAADVDQIVGHQLAGAMAPVVGVPMPSINRTGRLDCYYGVPPGQPITTAAVIIGIAGYTDTQSAQHRAEATVTTARNAGAQTSDVQVGAEHAVLLAGAQDQELVLAHGTMTILVSAMNGVLPAGGTGPPLIAMAQRALAAIG